MGKVHPFTPKLPGTEGLTAWSNQSCLPAQGITPTAAKGQSQTLPVGFGGHPTVPPQHWAQLGLTAHPAGQLGQEAQSSTQPQAPPASSPQLHSAKCRDFGAASTDMDRAHGQE